MDRYRERERVHNYRAGLPAAMTINVNRKKGAKPTEPLDFFGGRKASKLSNVESIRFAFRTLAANYKGRK